MYIAGTIVMSIALTAGLVIGFFYPAWKEQKGEPMSENQILGIRGLGIGLPLAAFVILQFVLRI
ncbi:hypothetical protein [Halobacillus halophilus]|uniref:hypothetical protein n=1 Tax=Halobacillus halophilus TaxID=1570 RepID=UPI001CD3E381|nr:hypothetical protein [Halobacillus halophilus]MCA1010568.1 hypothetical protein [Halobacillus halophilus]